LAEQGPRFPHRGRSGVFRKPLSGHWHGGRCCGREAHGAVCELWSCSFHRFIRFPLGRYGQGAADSTRFLNAERLSRSHAGLWPVCHIPVHRTPFPIRPAASRRAR